MIRNGTNLLFVIAGLVWSRSWRWRGVACCMLVVTALLGCLRMCIVLVLVRSVYGGAGRYAAGRSDRIGVVPTEYRNA